MTLLDLKNLKRTGRILVVIESECDEYIEDRPFTGRRRYLTENVFEGYMMDIPYDIEEKEVLAMMIENGMLKLEIA